MDSAMLSALNKHDEVLKELGDCEPHKIIEAQAVIEKIRTSKGHLDEEILREVHTLGSRAQKTLLDMVQSKRDIEAAYTTKYVR
jgi:hypothetical protein